MKQLLLSIMVALVAVGTAVGQPMHHGWHEGPYREEAAQVMEEWADRVPAELTFGEIEELAGRLSIPAQKAGFVARSSIASMILPGSGQFMNGDPLAGSLFLAGDLAITAGTLVAVYYLMPEPLRFDQLDYLQTPKAQVKAIWEDELGEMTLADSLPLAGVLAGGIILDHVLARVSAGHARVLASNRIASGEIEFTPRPELVIMAGGRLGLGMGMSY
jgi:hypothetical protein